MNKIAQKIVVSAIFLVTLYPVSVGAMEQGKTETKKENTNEQQVDFAKLLELYFQSSSNCTGCCSTCGGCGKKSEPKKTLATTGTKKHRVHKNIDFED